MMLRYVLLFHEMPAAESRSSHWDLMLEFDGKLLTWEIAANPFEQSPLIARQLPAHRLAYLDYEGPVSGNRGRVTRISRGAIEWFNPSNWRDGARLTDEHGEDWLLRLGRRAGPDIESDVDSTSLRDEYFLELMKPRDPAHPIRGVVGVVCRDDRLLVIRRSQFVRAPGQYCFPGGTIEPFETQEQALVREMHEELSLHVEPRRPLWVSESSWGVHLTWWLATCNDISTINANPHEIGWFDWLSVAEILELDPLLPGNRPFLAALTAGELDLNHSR